MKTRGTPDITSGSSQRLNTASALDSGRPGIRFGLSILTCLMIVTACATRINLTSPGAVYHSYLRALKKQDIDRMALCFDREGGRYTEEDFKLLARVFKEVRIRSARILEQETTSDTEVHILVEELLERHDETLSRARIRLTLVRIDDEWKIRNSRTLSLEKVK